MRRGAVPSAGNGGRGACSVPLPPFAQTVRDSRGPSTPGEGRIVAACCPGGANIGTTPLKRWHPGHRRYGPPRYALALSASGAAFLPAAFVIFEGLLKGIPVVPCVRDCPCAPPGVARSGDERRQGGRNDRPWWSAWRRGQIRGRGRRKWNCSAFGTIWDRSRTLGWRWPIKPASAGTVSPLGNRACREEVVAIIIRRQTRIRRGAPP